LDPRGIGNDTLNGGPGNDLLAGGGGNNTFVFEGNFGNDTIVDFNPNRDVLQLINFAAAMVDTKQVGTDTVLMIDANRSVTLHGVTRTNLPPTALNTSKYSLTTSNEAFLGKKVI